MSQSYTNLRYHLIFSTKERRPIITLDYKPQLYDYIGGILRGLGGISLGIGGELPIMFMYLQSWVRHGRYLMSCVT